MTDQHLMDLIDKADALARAVDDFDFTDRAAITGYLPGELCGATRPCELWEEVANALDAWRSARGCR